MKKVLCSLSLLFLVCALSNAFAGSATWNLNPSSGDWNNAANWTPATVPNGPEDTATFAMSNITGVSFSSFIETNSIVFDPGASAFTITSDPAGTFSLLTISGAGISNNSGIVENFVAATDVAGGQGAITLTDSASAGRLTIFTQRANPVVGNDSGVTAFVDDASAGSATFIDEGGVVSGGTSGVTNFFSKTTAAQGTFINNGSVVSGAVGGSTSFLLNSHAANATLIANGGSNGGGRGRIAFFDSATGDTARVELFGNGLLDLTGRSKALTLGSIEGDGLINLGSVNLSVGSSNLTTTFSGVILEAFGSGSLTKLGTGTLTLRCEHLHRRDNS